MRSESNSGFQPDRSRRLPSLFVRDQAGRLCCALLANDEGMSNE